MSFVLHRLNVIKRLKKAGIEVATADDPKYGVYAHQLGGQQIGHTVKAVHDGTIAWTAVPSNGNIKGKFKNHEEAKQYLADQHAEGMKTEAMAGDKKPVKKLDVSEMVSIPVGTEAVEKRDFNTKQRKAAAKAGEAMPDGSFPIKNVEDLHNAISLSGNSKHPESEVRAHIKARAKALGAEKELPADWVSKDEESNQDGDAKSPSTSESKE